MVYRNTLISTFFIAVAIAFAWTGFWSHQHSGATPPDTAPKMDAFMEDVQTTVMNKFGKPSLKITTPKMIHFTKDDASELIMPRLTLYRDSPEPWYVTANLAYATQGVENVEFRQNVMIQHPADPHNPATVIKTPTLMVHPNKKTAETTDEITMIQPDLLVKATGMHADMSSGDITLLSQARGEYVPRS